MEYQFTPQVGYGPFRFGMSDKEVHAILGKPESVSSVLDHLDLKDFDKEERPLVKGHFGEDYSNGDQDNSRPSMSYDPSGLVEIRLRHKKGSLIFNGVELFAAKRQQVITDLAALETTVFEGREDYFFPQSGIYVTKPKYWKNMGAVVFVKSTYIMKRLEFDDWFETKI